MTKSNSQFSESSVVLNPETTTSKSAVAEFFTVQTRKVFGVRASLVEEGVLGEAPEDRKRAKGRTRALSDAMLQVAASRSEELGGELGGVPFDPHAVREHIVLATAATPFVLVLRQMADAVEDEILTQREKLAVDLSHAMGVLRGQAKLKNRSKERALVAELQSLRPLKRTKAKAVKADPPKV